MNDKEKPSALTEDQWIELAERHANRDWNAGEPDGYLNAVKAICTDFASMIVRPTDDALWDQTLRERDDYHEWADKLAGSISLHLGADIGEHSSANNPWNEALDAIMAAPSIAELTIAAPTPAPSDAAVSDERTKLINMSGDMLAEQTYLGSCRDTCDNSGRIRWDRIQRVIDYLDARRAALAQTAPVGEATLSAFEFLKAALHADGDYAWSWHCNLAMPIMDSIHCAPELANKAGADLMQYLFGIDVRKFDQWHHDEQSEVIGPDWQVSNVLDDIARQCATKTDERHEYLPTGPATQRGFHAHKWVIESMEAAIQWDRRMNRVATPPASREALTVDYDRVVQICEAHGIGLPVDCVEMVVDIVRLATAAQREGAKS
jgi:hypothetical protein